MDLLRQGLKTCHDFAHLLRIFLVFGRRGIDGGGEDGDGIGLARRGICCDPSRCVEVGWQSGFRGCICHAARNGQYFS